MKVIVRNNTTLPNRIIRFIKWKLYGLGRKFKHLHYAEVYLKSEGQNPVLYKVNLKLGIPGKDIILSQQSENINELLHLSAKSAQRYLNKTKPKASTKSKLIVI